MKILNSIWFEPKKMEKYLRGQGFNGNPYSLLHGDLKETKKMTTEAQSKTINLHDDILQYAFPFHHHIVQKYGKKSFIWNGPYPNIIIMDTDLTRDVFFKYKTFRKNFKEGNPLTKLFVEGLVSQEGEQWAKHRSILRPCFYFEKLKLMVPAMCASCGEIVGKWEMLMAEKGWCEIDVWPFLEKLSADVISRTAFGSNYEEGKQIFKLLKEQANLTFQMIQSFYIPGWRFLPTKTNRKMKKISNNIRALLRNIISKREKHMKEGEVKNNDLLGMLLESNLKEIEDKNGGISMDDVIDNCKLFYFGGQDTTLSLIGWTLVMLCTHQNWQERAREEISLVFGKNNPDFEGLNRLKVVSMILNEVLRLYPPATLLFRTTHETTMIGDTVIPSGMTLLIPTILVHHDTEIWGDDAEEFNPQRFSQGVSNAAKKPNSFFPFGLGPRICIAQNYAILEAKLAIILFLKRFSFELSPSYSHAPQRGTTLQPRYGANMVLHKLQN